MSAEAPGAHSLHLGSATMLRFWHWAGGDRQVVLLLHGLGHHGRAWDDMADVFVERGMSVIAPDLEGHGSSTWSGCEGYSVERWAQQCRQLLNHLGVVPAIVAGHSLGAMIALDLCHRGGAAGRDGLILIEPPLTSVPPVGVECGDSGRRRHRSTVHLAEALADSHPLADERVLVRLATFGARHIGAGRVELAVDPALDHYSVPLRSHPGRHRLDDVAVMIVRGRFSARLSPSDAEQLRAGFGGGRAELIEIDKAGHGAHLDNPQEAADLVRHFVDRLCVGGKGNVDVGDSIRTTTACE